MHNGPTSPWSESNRSSLRQNQGDSIGTVDDSFEEALAESGNSSYKTELNDHQPRYPGDTNSPWGPLKGRGPSAATSLSGARGR